jgi:phosphatidylglycerol:prolipoprotein diacylglycerol transferase
MKLLKETEKLYYVAQQDLGPYLAQPWRILATWEGGMAFYGAIFGAVLALLIVARQRKISFWRLLDAGAFFAVVGQAFGRVGNIVNGDVVGYPTDLPWGFIYVHANSFVPEKGVAYQPAAVYELIFNILMFVFLWKVKDRLRAPGTLFATWLVTYSVGQILIFTQRMNDVVFMGLKQAQVTALVVIVLCIPLMWYLQGRESTPAGRGEDTEEAF